MEALFAGVAIGVFVGVLQLVNLASKTRDLLENIDLRLTKIESILRKEK